MNKLLKVPQLIGSLHDKVTKIYRDTQETLNSLSKIREAIGRIEARQNQLLNKSSIVDNEFRVFSQWGEDGIIQHLLRHIDIPRKIFVEFGIQDYRESNTRFLLVNKNWSGLVIDGSADYIQFIRKDPIYWQHNLKAVNAFINKDNINDLLVENGVQGEIGLLSVDIDGNDYWVWQAINVVSPAIVVTEYNFRFGKEQAVTVPYDPDFVRSQAHYSMIYYGASLKAVCNLAKQKGYAFVGCNSAGNNAFFVRRDLKPVQLPELSPEEGYVAGRFREARNQDGTLAFLSLEQEQAILAELPLVEVSSNE